MKKLILILIAGLSGCATPNTGVVNVGNGYYTITNTGAGAWVSTSELKTAALSEAEKHCDTKKKTLQIVTVKEIPAGPFVFPEAGIVYYCQ